MLGEILQNTHRNKKEVDYVKMEKSMNGKLCLLKVGSH
jgi:hypothetical protein